MAIQRIPGRTVVRIILSPEGQMEHAEATREQTFVENGQSTPGPTINEVLTSTSLAILFPQAEAAARANEMRQARDAALAGKAAAEARVAELEAELAGPSTERSIHKAYLRAALASIDKLAEVDAAVQAAGAVKWELWANATTIRQDDADVNAIADALGIDLAAVFTAARAIRTARGG